MRLLNIESSPRGSRSASIAVTSAFVEAYRQAYPGVIVDTLNVWEEKLPDFDQEAIGAKYKGVYKQPMDEAETSASGTKSRSWQYASSKRTASCSACLCGTSPTLTSSSN
jgi:FMN-dependent NADH-azoreductase